MNNQLQASESALYPIKSILAIMSQEIEEEVVAEEELEEEVEEVEEEEEEGKNLEEELEARDKKIKELEDLIIKNKKKEKEVKPEQHGDSEDMELSRKDKVLYALLKNNVHEEDFDLVIDYAKARKIEVTEALNSGTIKAILKENQEDRETQSKANTGTTRKGATEKDVDTLVRKARNNESPQTVEDMQKVFLRMKGIE